jgi:type II secretory pathway pseudopilin PulG
LGFCFMPYGKQIPRSNPQSGYSLLMVIFLVATMLLISAIAVPDILTQGRREREEETIWRGEQYQRAIGMYFRAFGRYPTKIEDLTKQTNGNRFLRQAYTDPNNKEDGSWRFIYVGPNGQLVGSKRRVSLLQSLLTTPAIPTATAQQGAQPSIGTTPPTGTPPAGLTSNQPQPLSGAVIGGNIIGVGSKVSENSIRVYQGADTYDKWEFIWNPVQQIAIPGQQNPAGPAAPQQSPNPVSPAIPFAPQTPQVPAPVQ